MTARVVLKWYVYVGVDNNIGSGPVVHVAPHPHQSDAVCVWTEEPANGERHAATRPAFIVGTGMAFVEADAVHIGSAVHQPLDTRRAPLVWHVYAEKQS